MPDSVFLQTTTYEPASDVSALEDENRGEDDGDAVEDGVADGEVAGWHDRAKGIGAGERDGNGRLDLVRGQLPHRVAGYQDAAGDAEADHRVIVERGADLFDQPAGQRQAIEHEDDDTVGHRREDRRAEHRQAEQNGRDENHQRQAGQHIRRGVVADEPRGGDHRGEHQSDVDHDHRQEAEVLAGDDLPARERLGRNDVQGTSLDLAGDRADRREDRHHPGQEVHRPEAEHDHHAHLDLARDDLARGAAALGVEGLDVVDDDPEAVDVEHNEDGAEQQHHPDQLAAHGLLKRQPG